MVPKQLLRDYSNDIGMQIQDAPTGPVVSLTGQRYAPVPFRFLIRIRVRHPPPPSPPPPLLHFVFWRFVRQIYGDPSFNIHDRISPRHTPPPTLYVCVYVCALDEGRTDARMPGIKRARGFWVWERERVYVCVCVLLGSAGERMVSVSFPER